MLRITPENKMAHLDLIKGMYTLKQYSVIHLQKFDNQLPIILVGKGMPRILS